jgi:hypothetical protein
MRVLCKQNKAGEDSRIGAVNGGVPIPVFYGKGSMGPAAARRRRTT